MSTNDPGKLHPNAGPGDVARLWDAIQHEFPWQLRVEVIPRKVEGASGCVAVQLVSPLESQGSLVEGCEIWATRDFYSPLYLISWNQLFDLLIVGYRNLSARKTEQEPLPPNPRVK
jgi:hypothetical protein